MIGSHSLQAFALVLFLVSAVTLCAGAAMGRNLALLGSGIALMAMAMVLFRKCKELESGRS